MNDAFGAAHRAHASTAGVAEHLRPAVAGLLLEREVTTLRAIVEAPERPLVVVLGGAKVSDKIALIDRFLDTADTLLIGGAMCFSFFRAQGIPTGDSLVEEEGVELARKALEKAEASDCRLLLPRRPRAGRPLRRRAPSAREQDGTDVPDGWMGLDVGPRTAAAYAEEIERAGTVFWNGPMGAFEMEPFAAGTRAVAEAVARGARHHRGRRRRLRRRARRSSASPTRSTTSRPAAARRWSCSRASRCPGWRRSTMPDRRPAASSATGSSGARAPRPRTTATRLARAAARTQRPAAPADVGICAPFTALDVCVEKLERQRASRVYAQNMHQEETGAFTGEVSAAMLTELGVDGVVLGHSERRQYFGETDRALQEKVPAALAAGLRPILCVGETEEEREAGETERKLRHQVQEGLEKVEPERLAEVTIAYEPIWAIGTGKVATPEIAQEAIAFVRALVGDRSKEAAERDPRALRRQREARQRGRDPRAARRGRRAGRRREPRPGGLRADRGGGAARSAWSSSTAGASPSPARATRSSWPTRRCSTSSGRSTRTPR